MLPQPQDSQRGRKVSSCGRQLFASLAGRCVVVAKFIAPRNTATFENFCNVIHALACDPFISKTISKLINVCKLFSVQKTYIGTYIMDFQLG